MTAPEPPFSDAEACYMLRKAEQAINRDGWDQRPRLSYVFHRRPGAMSLRQMPLDIGSPTQAYLTDIAVQLGTDSAWSRNTRRSIRLLHPDLRGIAFVQETWSNTHISPGQFAQLRNEGRSLADLPTSNEARDLFMIDFWGRIYALHRNRGKKVFVDRVAHSSGAIVAALLSIVTSIAEVYPDTHCDRQALTTVTLLNTQQAQSLYEQHAAAGTLRTSLPE